MNTLHSIFFILALTMVCFATEVYMFAEEHTVSFDNKCGRGTPILVSQRGEILSTGKAYKSKGPLIGAIAYLQTGNCGLNGDHCTTVETTLKNPTCPGCGSSTDITLIPPHTFSVTTAFKYKNGCDGQGHVCKDQKCPDAFHKPSDTHVQVGCQTDGVDLVIAFC